MSFLRSKLAKKTGVLQFFDTRTVLPLQSQEFIIVGRDANGGKKEKKAETRKKRKRRKKRN